MNRTWGIIVIIMITLVSSGCSKKESTAISSESIKPVRVIEVSEEVFANTLKYIGTVGVKELKHYSFNQSGKLTSVYVEKGQRVKKGTLLAQLDTNDHNLALEASLNNLSKAISSYEFVEETYKRMKALYTQGAISRQEYEKMKMELDVSEANLKNSLVDYESRLNFLENTQLYADIDGYIVDVRFKEGEVVGQGHPVVIIRDEQLIVNIGVPQDDILKIRDSIAEVSINGSQLLGQVVHIDQIPDGKSRTYKSEIALVEQEDLSIGAIAEVTVYWGEEKGIAIPILSVMNRGYDYVFIIQEDRVLKKQINIETVINDHVIVNGLDQGDLLIVEGFRNVTEGDKALIIN